MPIINLLDFGNADTMFLKNPSNLRINGETSQIVEAETCHLTWNAAEVDPPQDITYYVNIGRTQEVTTNLYWDLTNPSQYTTSTYIDVYAQTDDGTQSGTTDGVAFNYKPAISISAPYGLKVNGSTSSSSNVCNLTWNAATLTGTTGTITYEIYCDDTKEASTTNTSYSFSRSDYKDWSNVSIKVRAYNTNADYSSYSNTVTFTYKVGSTRVMVNDAKWADVDNSSYANKLDVANGKIECKVGRATTSAPVGTALQFLEPEDGWSAFSKATLHVWRMNGTDGTTIRLHKLNIAFSSSISAIRAYYGNDGTSMGTVNVDGIVNQVAKEFTYDIKQYLPTSGEFAMTLVSRNSYTTINGSTAYIQLEP